MGKKQVTNKDTTTVYWTAKTDPERQTYVQLLWGPPVPLSKIMPEGNGLGRSDNYKSCAALTPMLKNTYAFIHPLTHSVSLSGNVASPIINADLDVWLKRQSPLKNCYGIDYDFGWLFFSEESVQIKMTPTYFHNTSVSKTAYVASGSYDISKWFRMITPTYILWEGQSTLTLTEGEPAFYFEFLTNKKVILKQFECTEELRSLSNQVVYASNLTMTQKSLEYRYKRFFQTNRHKRVLKLIKDNLLE
jgi:hypothetical protein